MWLLPESRTRHLSLRGTVGHLARVAYFACVALMEDSQSTGQCPQALCRHSHRFKDTRDFHLWGQNRQMLPLKFPSSLQRDTVFGLRPLLFLI